MADKKKIKLSRQNLSIIPEENEAEAISTDCSSEKMDLGVDDLDESPAKPLPMKMATESPSKKVLSRQHVLNAAVEVVDQMTVLSGFIFKIHSCPLREDF